MRKRKYIKRSEYEADPLTITYSFPDEPNLPPLVVDVTAMPPEVIERAAWYGLNQKIGDAAAGAAGDAVSARTAMANVLHALLEGDWSRTGESADTWVEAVARARGVELQIVRARWAKLTAEQRRGVRACADVVRAHAEILRERAERLARSGGTTPIDLDELFPGL
jgi:hypothetical protein